MTELEAEVVELRRRLDELTERVRIDAVAEAVLIGGQQGPASVGENVDLYDNVPADVLIDGRQVRGGDYVLIDGFPTKIDNVSSDGKWTYRHQNGSYAQPFRVPPSDDVRRLYTIDEVMAIVAKVRSREVSTASWGTNDRR